MLTFDYRKILVPIDFSETSAKALNVGLTYANLFDAELVVLHVEEPVHSRESVLQATDELNRLELGVKQRVHELVERGVVTPHDQAKVHFEVRGGKPWVEIVHYANERQIDLIVMGTHGTTGLKHILIGSQCERVVRRANCHVLAVKPDGFDSRLEGIPDKFLV